MSSEKVSETFHLLLIEPFYSGSHKTWADNLKHYLPCEVTLLALPGRNWKWNMHSAAMRLQKEILQINRTIDAVLVSDMVALGDLKAVAQQNPNLAVAKWFLYFHENQITYPWSATDQDVRLKRDNHYGWMNFTSFMMADHCIFNSEFHKKEWLTELPKFLRQFPDGFHKMVSQDLSRKCSSLPIPLALESLLTQETKASETPTILWNHRWEYDKNPATFFDTIEKLKNQEVAFKLIVLGEHTKRYPKEFDQAKEQFKEELLHFGYAESREEYKYWLGVADVLPVTSNQDFFGISAVEAMAAGCYPLLPNRLAFPQHVADPKHLYQTDDELFDKLKTYCLERPTYSERAKMQQYDVANVIPTYMKKISELTPRG